MNKPLCVCLLAEKDGLVFAVSRKNDPKDFGLPGGKVEKGETPIDALVRELNEETGHVLTGNAQLVYVAQNKGYWVEVYSCSVSTNPINPVSETGVVKWVSWYEVCSGSFGAFNMLLWEYLEFRKGLAKNG